MAAMSITFLVPHIHERPTGGNIYNRRIITELPEEVEVDVMPVAGAPEDEGAVRPPDANVLLVDSLLLRSTHITEGLRAITRPTVVLVAHSLHCIDPRTRDSADASRERSVLPLFDGVITTSDFAKQAVVNEDVPDDRIAVVPPGLDASYRDPVHHSTGHDPPRILTVANVIPGKGLPDLVEALSAVTDIEWTWTLVGDDTLDPDFAGDLAERMRRSPIEDRTTWSGPVPPSILRTRYDRADVFVLPSHFETCSMATREAMARALPVVTYDVGGLSENMGGEDAGILVDPDIPDGLQSALRPVLERSSLRKHMGRAARKRSQAFPSWSESATRFRSALRAWTSMPPREKHA